MTTAQRWVSAQEVAVLLSLELVFGAIFAFWFLGETFGIFSFVGAGMVLVGIFLMLVGPVLVKPELELREKQEI